MISSKNELLEAVEEEGIPLNVRAIWARSIPECLEFTLENPDSLFEDFLHSPEMFPRGNELIILWQANQDYIVGYLRKKKIYIKHYMEDHPRKYEKLGSTYQQMISDVVAKLIMRKTDNAELAKAVQFLQFNYLSELRQFMETDPDWEDNTAKFIASIESK